jgi:large subunit ribosomal protein L17
MRHGISGRKFGRDTAQRRSLFVNLAKSLLRYEQIITTLPKAKDLRPYVEKMLTCGKNGSLSCRRNLFARLRDDELVSKVFGPLALRYANRNGGYTRIVKCGFRRGDKAPIAVIELLDRDGAGGKFTAPGGGDRSRKNEGQGKNARSGAADVNVGDVTDSTSAAMESEPEAEPGKAEIEA